MQTTYSPAGYTTHWESPAPREPQPYHIDLEMNHATGEFWRICLLDRNDHAWNVARIEVWLKGEPDVLVYDDLAFEQIPAKAQSYVLLLLQEDLIRRTRVAANMHAFDRVMAALARKPKFDNVFCSNCGREFGPGDHGFSHCENHAGLVGKS